MAAGFENGDGKVVPVHEDDLTDESYGEESYGLGHIVE